MLANLLFFFFNNNRPQLSKWITGTKCMKELTLFTEISKKNISAIYLYWLMLTIYKTMLNELLTIYQNCDQQLVYKVSAFYRTILQQMWSSQRISDSPYSGIDSCDFLYSHWTKTEKRLAGICYNNKSTLVSTIFQCLGHILVEDYEELFRDWISRLKSVLVYRETTLQAWNNIWSST